MVEGWGHGTMGIGPWGAGAMKPGARGPWEAVGAVGVGGGSGASGHVLEP